MGWLRRRRWWKSKRPVDHSDGQRHIPQEVYDGGSLIPLGEKRQAQLGAILGEALIRQHGRIDSGARRDGTRREP